MSIERNLRLALHQLVEAIEYTPMGVRGIKAMDNARKALEAAQQPATGEPMLSTDIAPRPLSYSLDDYHRAPSEGALHYTWQDKPHRLLYDLIAAVAYYAGKQPATSEPDEWKLVPIVPTEKMLLAYTGGAVTNAGFRWCRHQWSVMLAAAPAAHPAPSTPSLIEEAISSGHFGVLPMKATTLMCKAGWAASGGELTFQQIGHIYEEMYKARPLPDAAMLAAKEPS